MDFDTQSIALSAFRSGVNYILPGAGLFIGAALALKKWTDVDVYASNFTVGYEIKPDDSQINFVAFTGSAVGGDFQAKIGAQVWNACLMYARAADTLGFVRVPFRVTWLHSGDPPRMGVISSFYVSPWGVAPADGLMRAVLGALQNTPTIYPSVPGALAGDPDSYNADQIIAMIQSAVQARDADIASWIARAQSGENVAASIQGYAQQQIAAFTARMIAQQEQYRAHALASFPMQVFNTGRDPQYLSMFVGAGYWAQMPSDVQTWVRAGRANEITPSQSLRWGGRETIRLDPPPVADTSMASSW